MRYDIEHYDTKKYKKVKRRKTKIIIVLLIVSMIFLIKHLILKPTTASDKIEDEQNMNIQNENLSDKNNNEAFSDNSKDEIIVIIDDDTELKQDEEQDKAEIWQTVDLDYFKDAVFIGDSRTEGFIINNGLSADTTSYTHKGLTVETTFTDGVINMNGKKLTILEALEKTSFSKVYIMLGINETGWVYSNLFIKKYAEIIDQIRVINPNCIIYVQSILPVSQTVSNEHSYIKNSKIEEYNSLIQNMAEDKNIYYLDVTEAVADQEGALPDEAATDGIHLNKKYCEKWLEYLENHAIKEK